MSVPIPIEVLNRFVPNGEGLFDYLRTQVDNGMLWQMAMFDCGSHNAAPQFAALKRLRDSGVIPAPMEWEPKEALQLTTCLEPGKFGDPSKEEVRREHLESAFACAVMLRAEVEPENFFIGRTGAVANLATSALYLGEEFVNWTGSFLVWRLDQLTGHENRPLFAFTLVALYALSREASSVEVVVLCDWVLAEQASERDNREEKVSSFNHRLRRDKVWRTLGLNLKEHAATLQNPRVRERLTEIANLVR